LSCEQPDLVGTFFLPPADRNPQGTMALGNTFAALTELYHYSVPGTMFSARYDEKEKNVSDPEAPYQRCIFLPLPEATSEDTQHNLTGLAADFLARNLTAPLGKMADQCRANFPPSAKLPRGPACQTFGLYRISWPRQAMLRNVARHLCEQLVRRWLSKDAAPVRAAVQTAVVELWAQKELDGEQALAQIQHACEEAIGQTPEERFTQIVEPLTQLDPFDSNAARPAVRGVLAQLDEILGRPEGGIQARPGSLSEPLKAASNQLTAEWGRRMTGFAARLIELPEFRLAGAEEAVRQLITAIEQVLQHYEPLFRELTTRASAALEQISTLLTSAQAAKQAKKQGPVLPHLIELLRVYPRWRCQALVLQAVVNTYVSLRGQMSDQLREINYCRTRLHELGQNFAKAGLELAGDDAPANGRNIYPAGCRTLPETVELILRGVSAEELQELDGRMQELIQKQFRALMHVCLSSANLLKELRAAMQREAEDFVSCRLAGANVAEMYLAQYETTEQAQGEISGIFEQAVPALAGTRTGGKEEINILAVPADEVGERFRALAAQAMPEVSLVSASSRDDIILYREVPHVAVADLDQLGSLGFDAYRQLATTEHFTPHSRSDIVEWRAAGAGTR
jgi:hypothetical protein